MKFIIVCGVFVHLVFLFSIFDIYFKSPVVTGVAPRPDLDNAPADRLVLFVADGLRADSFYRLNDGSTNAPYLRSILNSRGSWGVSHTRVPTESRPGHVALIAGLYEDPSAVARGWQENPVHFDSAFNRSTETWSWGSPDILPMFSKGAVEGKVHIDCYNPEDEDFSGIADTSLLDTWVFHKVEKFFDEAELNESLSIHLHQKKIILFLHLLGLDTAGHTHKPYSKELENNLNIVDNGIKRMENIIEKYYNFDGKTSYIFTSDHGMTDWGSHGSGSAHETETPVVAWGAGVNFPKEMKMVHRAVAASPLEWNVNDKYRRDVMQADITPLIATLIGTAVPVNSVGILPLSYVNSTHEYLAKAYFSNALQLGDQYQKKRSSIEIDSWEIFNHPFKDLDDSNMNTMISNIEHFISIKKFDDAVKLSGTMMELSLRGLEYYHKYYQVLLLLCISLSFIGWILWLVINVFSNATETAFSAYQILINTIFTALILLASVVIYVQSLPVLMYMYCILPIALWWIVCKKSEHILNGIKFKTGLDVLKGVGYAIMYLIAAELLVLSFFYRYFLSICLILLCLWGCDRLKKSKTMLKCRWILSSLALAVFPAMPIVKGAEGGTTLLLSGGVVWVLMAILQYKRSHHDTSILQISFLAIAVWVAISTRNNFDAKMGLSWQNMISSWFLLVASPLLIFTTPLDIGTRLSCISKSLAVPFILLSVSHEPLFLFTLFLHIDTWLLLEHYISKPNKNLQNTNFDDHLLIDANTILKNEDFRRSYLFLFYIMVCFFGTGNIASLSSFDPSWVRCFIARFSPFLMGALIILKTLIPFHLVTCYWHAINIVMKVPTRKLFLSVLIFSNIMGLHFLFLVRNQGSWLDIGTSISHYVIMQTTVVVLLIIYSIAKYLTNSRFPSSRLNENSLESGKHK